MLNTRTLTSCIRRRWRNRGLTLWFLGWRWGIGRLLLHWVVNIGALAVGSYDLSKMLGNYKKSYDKLCGLLSPPWLVKVGVVTCHFSSVW